MIDKAQLKIHFSKNAKTYDKYSNVQKKMKDILINYLLKNLKSPSSVKNILEIGCGTGSLTKTLLEIFPNSNITAIDISPGMIKEVKNKFKSSSINFICDDIENINLSCNYDLIISNATFQWFNNLPKTLEKLYLSLNPNGILSFSTFGNKTFYELHECFKKAIQELHIKESISPGQSFYTLEKLTNICNSLEDTSWRNTLIYNEEIFLNEYFSNCKEFLNSIKKVGATNSNKNNRCTSPKFIKKVMNLYDKNFTIANKVITTYHCLFIHIQKQNNLRKF
ncbi:malonyl-ACP O-methyltransferase BioC [Clostridium botulinum]|uniref:malonyl-ACP O-methyltransferase BioC n=1 Tax=Clostridium botulinum TaxID=1491 RepID=UPI0004D40E7A|nr:malonyl-ACP O-methyltransferase BioC [Clostridium botulinum]KEI07182.1 biotin biosynthesis protein BioC [Clostridium botulinum C/D str. BKT75002]KEI08740.1 biotin biosynthesis protein BioC [Clostridium botulinum C/D str. BKT2873]QPW60109.1 malonyl-ACP O-methyltransferase BioC [Clostridium botulinum]